MIETAAFWKLLELRGVYLAKEGFAFSEGELTDCEVLMSLVKSCPLNESSQPEELGEIHESLVAKRGSNWQTAQKFPESTFRKRSGTFYTPQVVVDEILRMTLLQRLECSTPDPAEVAELSLLDPAAGCGAFLVSAYRKLLDWHVQSHQSSGLNDDKASLVLSRTGPALTFDTCHRILTNNLFGVDSDPTAIEVVRRTLWLVMIDYSTPESLPVSWKESWDDLKSNFKPGHSLIGASFSDRRLPLDPAAQEQPEKSAGRAIGFDWPREFPQVAQRDGFDFVVGNPPYRRKRDYKEELDLIQETSWGRHHRSARMDLWYYFVHRGIDLLKQGGTLSFITNAYWMHGSGSSKLITALREQVRVDELFLLRNLPIFQGVTGQHVIFKMTRTQADQNTVIRMVPEGARDLTESFREGSATVVKFEKSPAELFVGDRIDVFPSAKRLLEKLQAFPRLCEFGDVRQGIAENPATINLRTMQRFPDSATDFNWILGEGVFSLTDAEIVRLRLTQSETQLLRSYHDLCDLDRYWSASQASRQLIYSTRLTCPQIGAYPNIEKHLRRFRSILEARRETRQGKQSWWHLHWPRDERIWLANKLNIVQMAIRPSAVATRGPSYVPFSVNVFVPLAETHEHLNYFCAILNSRLLWAWFAHHAKRRGIGLELNGHVLKQAPLARINFSDSEQSRLHDELVGLVDRRLSLSGPSSKSRQPLPEDLVEQRASVEEQIEVRIHRLFGLESSDIELVDGILSRERG